MSSELEQIEPGRAVEMYLQSRENELAQATLYSHRSRLSHFIEWFDIETEYEHVSELGGIDLHEYRLWRRTAGEDNEDAPNVVTMKTQLDTLRVFIRWCESIDAVTNDLSESVISPTLSNGEGARDEMLPPEAGSELLEYLKRFDYASRVHVEFLLIWRGIMRRGAIRAIDKGEDTDLHSDNPQVRVRHRTETGTPLKNQGDGERTISIRRETADVIEDYIDHHRDDVTDAHGREPLVTTAQGRPHPTTVQADAYAVTRPCKGPKSECPHGRDVTECDAATDRQQAYRCPSSRGPHAIRRGAITRWLSDDVPPRIVGKRCNTSPDVIEDHYDERTESEKAEQRREYFDP
jgi:integrase